ncbi:MAG: hypothetical protein NTV05_13225 [Acidobacteria bacterium]|nr:hypothetical protein [Acidobacteriota bacterium]
MRTKPGKGEQGLSLVEATIILLVLMLLTSVLAPSISGFVREAQWVKVKADCEAIGVSLSRLSWDVGPCLKKVAAVGCINANRIEVLQSLGSAVVVDLTAAPDVVWTNSEMVSANWNSDTNADTMESQFVANGPGYRTPYDHLTASGSYPAGLLFGLGWRGAYLSSPIGPDPWGSKYLVNTGFMTTTTDAAARGGEGNRGRWWNRDVTCVSPGPNQVIETPFFEGVNRGMHRTNDDFVFVISGSGR